MSRSWWNDAKVSGNGHFMYDTVERFNQVMLKLVSEIIEAVFDKTSALPTFHHQLR